MLAYSTESLPKCKKCLLKNSERPKRQKLVSAETEASATFTEASATFTEASAEASAESLSRNQQLFDEKIFNFF